MFFEFTANTCCVKSQVTKESLFQGTIRDGLYVFPDLHSSSTLTNTISYASSHIAPTAFTVNKMFAVDTVALWHCKLGHPSNKIIQHVLKLCTIPFNTNKTATVCTSCCRGKSHQLPFTSSTSAYTALLQLIYSNIRALHLSTPHSELDTIFVLWMISQITHGFIY